MNIACDGRALVGPRTGVGMWTVQLCRGLCAHADWSVTLLATTPPRLPEDLVGPQVVAAAPGPRLPGTLWLHTVVPKWLARSDAAVFVGSLAVVPRRCPVPAVSVVHDLTPRTLARRHTLANRFCFNAYLECSLDEARRVVAVSNATAAELCSVYPWVSRKLQVIENAIDPSFFEPLATSGSATRSQFAAGRPYVLHLGTLEPRKGLHNLLAAWEELVAADGSTPDLVLAGALGWQSRPLLARLASSPWPDRIHRPGYVTDAEVRALMQHAEAFVLVSEGEGFGLPLAEAMASRAACVASDVPALREVAGDAALLVPPGDVAALAAAIRRALQADENTRLRELGRRRATRYTPERMTSRWRELLTDL